LSIHFCPFQGNTPTSCLVFGINLLNHNFACLNLRNNTATSIGSYLGLVVAGSNVTMVHSVFQANSFRYFVGTNTESQDH
jgi:hypothetical protein